MNIVRMAAELLVRLIIGVYVFGMVFPKPSIHEFVILCLLLVTFAMNPLIDEITKYCKDKKLFRYRSK